MTRAKTIQNLLFGRIDKLDGKLALSKDITIPRAGEATETYEWEGNRGLIPTILEKISKLEDEIRYLKAKKK